MSVTTIMLADQGEGSRMLIGAPVYVCSVEPPTVALAQGDSYEHACAIGLVCAIGETGPSVAFSGPMTAHLEHWDDVLGPSADGARGLRPGHRYYLDTEHPGRLTHRLPITPGRWRSEIGVALSQTSFMLRIEQPVEIPPWYPFELVTFDPTKIEESPWNRGEWHGRILVVDGTGQGAQPGDPALPLLELGDVRPNDSGGWGDDRRSQLVDRVIALDEGDNGAGARSGDYRETCSGIAHLKDGRFVAWESSIDVTGSGFHADAYGGDADIWIAATARGAWLALSEKARECLRFTTLPREEEIVNVMHDRYLELRVEIAPLPAAPAPPAPATLFGELAPDGSDGDANAEVAAPIGTMYIQQSNQLHWIREASGWQIVPTTETITRMIALRTELERMARASGDFGDLVEPRVAELIERWDRHYDELRRGES